VVASRHLRLSAVSYGHLQSTTEEITFLDMLKIIPRKNQDGGSVIVNPEHLGYIYGPETVIPRIITDQNRDASGVQNVKVRTRYGEDVPRPPPTSVTSSLLVVIIGGGRLLWLGRQYISSERPRGRQRVPD